MKYVLRDTQLNNKYIHIYQSAEEENSEKKCLVGIEKKYRISTKDSYYDNISDPDTIFEQCLYPLYLKGDIEIENRIQTSLREMANSSNVLEVFQVYNFVLAQDILCKIYDNIPFVIDFSDIITILVSRLLLYEQDMKNYRENGFERYKDSLWDNIQKIIRKSPTIKHYL